MAAILCACRRAEPATSCPLVKRMRCCAGEPRKTYSATRGRLVPCEPKTAQRIQAYAKRRRCVWRLTSSAFCRASPIPDVPRLLSATNRLVRQLACANRETTPPINRRAALNSARVPKLRRSAARVPNVVALALTIRSVPQSRPARRSFTASKSVPKKHVALCETAAPFGGAVLFWGLSSGQPWGAFVRGKPWQGGSLVL